VNTAPRIPHSPSDTFITEYNNMIAGDPWTDTRYLADTMSTPEAIVHYIVTDPDPSAAYRFMYGTDPKDYTQ
jgi:hypothetical protein